MELLSQQLFREQVEALFDHHGASAFAALAGTLPPMTLFVDGQNVVADSEQSPRHRYGVYCELNHPLHDEALAQYMRRWLESGEAYSTYISMKV